MEPKNDGSTKPEKKNAFRVSVSFLFSEKYKLTALVLLSYYYYTPTAFVIAKNVNDGGVFQVGSARFEI